MDSINSVNIYKYKNLDINKININDFDIKYNSNTFYIQGPLFTDYEITNHNDKKYLELKLNEKKGSHINFLLLIDSIEIKLNKFIKQDNIESNLKTQIITNIQNKKSLKVKITDSTCFYNSNKEHVSSLYSNKISVLFKLEFYKFYYSWVAVQILQLE
tara:strand:- start:138 stop:611 length:474 start_codon:yes stop_codon:yes gene_type:complete